MAAPRLRPARAADEAAVVTLLHDSASEVYDRYAGGADPALRILGAAFRARGSTASCETVTVAELGGDVAGVLAVFPVREAARRANRFLSLSLWRIPPWRWARAMRIFRHEAVAAAPPPAGALYVDALATAAAFRRRGVARALLAEAEREAVASGATHLALDTERHNDAARALYRSAGFAEVAERDPVGRGPGYVSLVKALD